MRNASFKLTLFGCVISICCVGFFSLFYSLLDLRSSECDVVSLYVVCCSVNVSVCFMCCVFVNCLVKQFAMCLGIVAILLCISV